MNDLRTELFKSFVNSLLNVHNVENVLIVDNPDKKPSMKQPFGMLSTEYFPDTVQNRRKILS